jgi:FtsH-binding integral membrane protein
MFIGLIATGVASLIIVSNQALVDAIYSNSIIFFGLIIAELALVFFLSLRITKISFGIAVISFCIYSLLNGITLASIFLIYTATSIVSTFFITALVFGVMSFYGYATKRDLTSIGNLAFMALVGVIIASVVNLFLKNNIFSYVLSYLSIAIFIGLTAYDTQKIKQMESEVNNKNLGVLGALMLYLDFINIFLNLLRILGRKRD